MLEALRGIPARCFGYGFWLFGSFPDSSAGKESTCNAGDPGLILGSGRSTGKGIGYPLQYSWASLVAQLVKNPPAMWETWVWSLGWEYPLEKGKATYSSILAWRIPWTEEPGGVQSMGSQRVEHDWATNTVNPRTRVLLREHGGETRKKRQLREYRGRDGSGEARLLFSFLTGSYYPHIEMPLSPFNICHFLLKFIFFLRFFFWCGPF